MIRRLLIANRGEIAVRVARGARELGIVPLGVFSEADDRAYHLRFMEESACIGPPPATQSYLNGAAIVAAAKSMGADAVHPGYGFLSEQPQFAQMAVDAGLTFVGPTPQSMSAMGSKIEAKRRVREFDVPVVPGYDGDDQSADRLLVEAERVGFPLLVKASAGGGGRGMRVVGDVSQFDEALAAARREALAAFGDETVLLERYLRHARHIEFQILADTHGNAIHLGERECSIQRRHQKVVEEAPSVALTPGLRAEMGAAAVRAARSVEYVNAGTCEFVLDENGKYYFLEMNTRLQVEHPVTELVYGIDLVHWQLRIAGGERLTIDQSHVQPRGWAIETRVYAEDPANGLLPSTGTIARWDPPEGPGIRVDAGVTHGSDVSMYYDPMLAKTIVWGENRAVAIDRLTHALEDFRIEGVASNIPLLLWIARDPAFRSGDFTTQFLPERLNEAIFRTKPEVDAETLAAAAAAILRRADRPWRLGGVGIPLHLQIAGEDVTLEADATPDPLVWDLDGAYKGRIDLRRPAVPAPQVRFAAPPRAEVSLHRGQAAGNGRVVAPMPGRIAKVAVRDGAGVSMHDLLVVLEAMKMEHRIEAPSDGTVSAVHVREGEIVGADQLLLEMT